MIDAKELMIGNLVTVDNPKYHPKLKDVVLMVTAIKPAWNIITKKEDYSISLVYPNQEPNTYYDSYSQFIKYIKPIKLDEELYLKMGFVWKNGMLRKGNIRVLEIQEPFGGGYEVFADNMHLNHIKKCHQLQNFYLTSTNEKLKIEL